MKDKLYAIVITETKEILEPKTFNAYWKNYGKNSLYGWNRPKKIYLTIGQARSGFAHIPDAMKEYLSIAEFTFNEFVQDGKDLMVEQKEKRETKEKKRREQNAKYWLEIAQQNFERAAKELENAKRR